MSRRSFSVFLIAIYCDNRLTRSVSESWHRSWTLARSQVVQGSGKSRSVSHIEYVLIVNYNMLGSIQLAPQRRRTRLVAVQGRGWTGRCRGWKGVIRGGDGRDLLRAFGVRPTTNIKLIAHVLYVCVILLLRRWFVWQQLKFWGVSATTTTAVTTTRTTNNAYQMRPSCRHQIDADGNGDGAVDGGACAKPQNLRLSPPLPASPSNV